MDELRNRISDKLIGLGVDKIESLDDKTIKRLEEVEEAIEDIKKQSNSLYEQLKKLKPNISMLTKHEGISFARKTIYNDEVLKRYVEVSLKEIPDYFNEEKVIRFKEDYDNIKEMYEKILVNIIDTQKLKYNLEEVKKHLSNSINECNQLKDLIHERDNEIVNLKKGTKIISLEEFERK